MEWNEKVNSYKCTFGLQESESEKKKRVRKKSEKNKKKENKKEKSQGEEKEEGIKSFVRSHSFHYITLGRSFFFFDSIIISHAMIFCHVVTKYIYMYIYVNE